MAMYAHEIGRMPADPYGAAATWAAGPAVIGTVPGCPVLAGRNGARCAFAATGPTPGPPPPCGMQKVLCRLRWDTSPPRRGGDAPPAGGLGLAPSMEPWPPDSWTRSATAVIVSSYTPLVDG